MKCNESTNPSASVQRVQQEGPQRVLFVFIDHEFAEIENKSRRDKVVMSAGAEIIPSNLSLLLREEDQTPFIPFRHNQLFSPFENSLLRKDA